MPSAATKHTASTVTATRLTRSLVPVTSAKPTATTVSTMYMPNELAATTILFRTPTCLDILTI